LRQLLLWLPNLAVAIAVLILGGLAANWLAGLVRGATAKGDLGNPDLLASIARVAVWAFAIVVALNQIGIARELVNTLFVATVGAVALALGLAFGIGGRARRRPSWCASGTNGAAGWLPSPAKPPSTSARPSGRIEAEYSRAIAISGSQAGGSTSVAALLAAGSHLGAPGCRAAAAGRASRKQRKVSAGKLPARPAKEVQSLLDRHRTAWCTLSCTQGEYLYVGVTFLRRAPVTEQEHEMGTADTLSGLRGFHQRALICGCAIGAIAFR
jgi:hypothetical protein